MATPAYPLDSGGPELAGGNDHPATAAHFHFQMPSSDTINVATLQALAYSHEMQTRALAMLAGSSYPAPDFPPSHPQVNELVEDIEMTTPLSQPAASPPSANGSSDKENSVPASLPLPAETAEGPTIADRIKRRSATKVYYGPGSLTPATATSEDAQATAPAPTLIRKIKTTKPTEELIAGPMKQSVVHNQFTPQHEYSQHPKAIESRLRRAELAQKSGTKRATQKARRHNAASPQPSPTGGDAPALPTDMQEAVRGAISTALGSREGTPTVTPAKRAIDEGADQTTATKRSCTQPPRSKAQDYRATSETLADDESDSSSDSDLTEDDNMTGNVTAMSLENIRKFSRPEEDLDWTKVKDPKMRHKKRAIVNSRAYLEKSSTEQARKKQLAAPEGLQHDGIDVAVAAINADPTYVMPAATSQTIDANTLADIRKYSLPGEQLDWTEVTEPAEGLRRKMTVINRKTAIKRTGSMWMPPTPRTGEANSIESMAASVPASSASPAAVVRPASGTETLDLLTPATSMSPVLSEQKARPLHPTTRRRITEKSWADIAKYAKEGEDLDWTKEPNAVERKRLQDLIALRKEQDPAAGMIRGKHSRIKAVRALDGYGIFSNPVAGEAPRPRSARKSTIVDAADAEETDASDESDQDDADGELQTATGVLHPVTGWPVKAQVMADIAKYSTEDKSLDWTKMSNPADRKRAQDTISYRRRQEQRERMAQIDKSMSSEADALSDTVVPSTPAAGDTARPRKARKITAVSSAHADGDAAVDDEDMSESDLPQPSEPFDHPGTKFQDDSFSDKDFIASLEDALRAKSGSKYTGFHANQCRRILTLLALASPPEAGEALFPVTSDKAAKHLAPDQYFQGPIIIHGQQPMPLCTLDEFLHECYDNSVGVDVQDPALRVGKDSPHVRRMTMRETKDRFSKPVKGAPINCLELSTHVEDGLRPNFLNNEDCRLLTKLKLPCSGDAASRLGYTEGWKEVEKWTLMAQAGALTEPHQDSHGYSTYITVNQGIVGFGWLSNPTADERAGWAEGHNTFIGGRWRYVVLRPGMTIYFPAGTVHFVFRHPAAGSTLAFGGHVLSCSQIVRWIRVLLDEQSRPNITNEDMSVSAPGYLNRVERFVKQALKTGEEGKWGGREAIEEFLRLKVEFGRQGERIAKWKKRDAKQGGR